ncbi:MAG TPA: YlxR family protein [Candidatus Caccousia avicola]|uniref:YlxR family protein n=1 Tax=Candidatus Caccousia avicola TaxID=2840721 RepID=A0A9D1AMV2_9FIRM|nr:YlxR family protein [Candidatus Caccousia avicola]
MMHQKKIPMRMCTGCGEMKPKKELVRVVKSPEGEVFLDLTGKKPGRGAYVCRSAECLKAARKARRLERAFSCRIPDTVYDRMEEELSRNE